MVATFSKLWKPTSELMDVVRYIVVGVLLLAGVWLGFEVAQISLWLTPPTWLLTLGVCGVVNHRWRRGHSGM